MAFIDRCYAVNRSSNSIYYSDDYGLTWTEVPSTVSTTSASDIGANPGVFNDILVLNGAGAATTPYLSNDGGGTFAPGANITGKEILFLSSTAIVTGGKRLKSGTGPEISISLDGGLSFSAPITTTSLFSYPGAVFGNITVMSVDFTSSAGGYIAIAGDEDNPLADQILARTTDRGNTFPDAIILSGPSYGVIRAVIGNPNGKVVFAAGIPGVPGSGKLYTIDKALTDIPVEVRTNLTVGDPTNTSITKFFTRPDGNLDVIYFIDSIGTVLKSQDGGSTWLARGSVPGNCVDILAIDTSRLIALSSSPDSIYVSVNDGVTWDQVAQPTWIDPEAVAYNTYPECDQCPPGYTKLGVAGVDLVCEKFQSAGPICKPPYQYYSVDQACASAADVQPANIVYAMDYSGSIDAAEKTLFINFVLEVNALIADRLALGTVEVAVVKWTDYACLTLPFTNDVNAINTNILNTTVPCTPFGNATSHINAFCTSVNALYQQSLIRPGAENVLIVFTDGANNSNLVGCDLTSIGLTPTVPTGVAQSVFNTFLNLANNAKQNLGGTGLKIMFVAVGSPTERFDTYNQMITAPLAAGLEPYPSKTPSGNYYYFDGGDFADIGPIVQQIRLGLASDQYPTDPCPPGCVGVGGDDNQGYCECRDEVVPVTCLYKLEDCKGVIPPFYSKYTFFANWFLPGATRGFVVTLKDTFPDYFPGCFILSKVPELDIPLVPPSEILQAYPDLNFVDCVACDAPSYVRFVDCTNPNNVQYSTEADQWQTSFADFGTVVVKSNRPDLSPDVCWQGDIITTLPAGAVLNDFLPYVSVKYAACVDCVPVDVPSYKLTDCQSNLRDIYTESDMSGALNSVTKVLQYPNICWFVSLNTDTGVTYETLTPVGIPTKLCSACLPRAASYTLTDCNNPNNQLTTTDNLFDYLDGVVRLTTTGDTCWQVTQPAIPGLVVQPVIVSQSFTTCTECNPQVYILTDCQNTTNVIYTILDFSAYVGQTVNLQEYPGVCWVVNITTNVSAQKQNVTVDGNPYTDCESCLVTYYQLTNCVKPDVILISTSTELARYVGRTITAAGYPGLCFTVTPPKCDCVRATINGIEYTANAQPTQFNGRNVYYITTDSGDELAIAWSINPNQWELFDRNTLSVYGINTTDTECPFSNFWTIVQGSPYIITTVGFCADKIYNIAPELDFVDCQPCINCI